MSLFLRIFLSFWLVMLLLAGSFILLQRFYGGEVIQQAEALLQTRAEVMAVLWREGGVSALQRWYDKQPDRHRLGLVNNMGKNLLQRPLPRFLHHRMRGEIRPGIEHGRGRHLRLFVELPGVTPRLFLANEIDPGRLHAIPLWIRILMAVVIIGLVSLLLASLLTRKVKPLRQAAQRMAEGDLSGRVDVKGSDEISALGADFNLMAERLNDLLQSQRQLVRDVSHELRSPLTRLRVALELAERSEDSKKALGRIEKEADELERLITELLSLARLESGQAGLERQRLQLDELIAKVVTDAEFEADAEEKQVSYRCEPAILVGDGVLLRSAVENVIRNAIRHTPVGSAVQVVLEKTPTGCIIRVRDAGSGVAEAELQTMFEPFTRTSEARERSSGGFGLGLAIARSAMELHGGFVSAKNHPQGGLEVSLSLPLSDNV
jgi:two-component system sensor histidine kinase CpxA